MRTSMKIKIAKRTKQPRGKHPLPPSPPKGSFPVELVAITTNDIKINIAKIQNAISLFVK